MFKVGDLVKCDVDGCPFCYDDGVVIERIIDTGVFTSVGFIPMSSTVLVRASPKAQPTQESLIAKALEEPKEATSTKCECGAATIGYTTHSTWCPKAG